MSSSETHGESEVTELRAASDSPVVLTDVGACRDAAEDLLARSAGPQGFVASPTDGHYAGVWARDAAVCILGALATGDDRWHPAIRATLDTLSTHASPLGQIPNTVWPDGWWDFGEHAATDPTAWFALAASSTIRAGIIDDPALRSAVTGASTWLRHQSAGGNGLLHAPGASDWMDSSLQRAGITLHLNTLFTWSLQVAEDVGLDTGPGPDSAAMCDIINQMFWPEEGGDPADVLQHLPEQVRKRGLPHPASVAAFTEAIVPERGHWGSHWRWGQLVDVVDVLGNSLAVIVGVGSAQRRDRVLGHLDEAGVADPFPSRTLDSPVVAFAHDGMLDPGADANQDLRWRNPPWQYHNGGSWPMVGGFHVTALARAGWRERAGRMLAGLANACAERGAWTFPEWRHGRNGTAGGARDQSWSAASFLLADAAASGRELPF